MKRSCQQVKYSPWDEPGAGELSHAKERARGMQELERGGEERQAVVKAGDIRFCLMLSRGTQMPMKEHPDKHLNIYRTVHSHHFPSHAVQRCPSWHPQTRQRGSQLRARSAQTALREQRGAQKPRRCCYSQAGGPRTTAATPAVFL